MYYSIEVKKNGRSLFIKFVHIYENRVTGLELSEKYMDCFIQVNVLELAAINSYLKKNGYQPVYSYQGCLNPDEPLNVPRMYGTIDRFMSIEIHENKPEPVVIHIGRPAWDDNSSN
jgi:hypothetical protein